MFRPIIKPLLKNPFLKYLKTPALIIGSYVATKNFIISRNYLASHINKIERNNVNVVRVDFNKALNIGFLLEGAATERQKQYMLMKQSELSFRKLLGKEASLYKNG